MSEKIPPEKPNHPNETWDEYKKRIKAKYGNKYDEYFRVTEGLYLFLEENTKAFMDMSPEEQKAYLERDRKKEADESAHRINKLHEVIKGEDDVTGGIYDALDHEQLLWVHACLQISSIYFYEKTVGKLTEEEKNQYHLENTLAAEMVLVDKSLMPKTHEDLKKWVIDKSKEKDYLIVTDVAKDVYEIIGGGPVPKHIKPIWPFISFTAFNTLPIEFKNIYGIKDTKIKRAIVNFNLFFLKATRPFLPPFFRLIAPARWAKQRITRRPDLKFKDKSNI